MRSNSVVVLLFTFDGVLRCCCCCFVFLEPFPSSDLINEYHRVSEASLNASMGTRLAQDNKKKGKRWRQSFDTNDNRTTGDNFKRTDLFVE